MKTLRLPVLIATGSFVLLFSLAARPPARETSKPTATPAPTPAPEAASIDPLARWLLQQDGGKDAITLPLGAAIQAATGKRVLPFDPANPADAAFLARLGATMDRILPRMNRPDSPARLAARFADPNGIAARFEDEIRLALRPSPGPTPGEAADAVASGGSYPALRLVDAAGGKAYYLAVTLYPTGKREDATRTGPVGRALTFHPGEGGRRITADGSCLLVGIEYNGKLDNDIAFLNWDVTDVANLPVRVAVTFEGNAGDVYHPGAVLTDGRKGSD